MNLAAPMLLSFIIGVAVCALILRQDKPPPTSNVVDMDKARKDRERSLRRWVDMHAGQ